MLSKEKFEKLAELIITIGVNIQKDQEVFIKADVETAQFTRIVVKKAYEKGASKVFVDYVDKQLKKIGIVNESIECLKKYPEWDIERKKQILSRDSVSLGIHSEMPDIFKDVDQNKMKVSRMTEMKNTDFFSQGMMANERRWCTVILPSQKWAEKVFPGDPDALEKLWKAVEITLRLDKEDPVKAWKDHVNQIQKHAKKLTSYQFETLHYTNSIGTDIHVGLAKGHTWCGGGSPAKDGVSFVPNLPTEEIFTCPDRNRVNGIVKSTKPLDINGTLVEDFGFEIKEGKVINHWAEKGKNAIDDLISTDEGSKYLGEVALVSKFCPVAKTGLIYFHPLYDENVCCHLALGAAYEFTVPALSGKSVEEKIASGMNDSMEHCDFMIGTDDLKIVGIQEDGKEVVVFENGDWAI